MKNILIGLGVLILIIIGIYFFTKPSSVIGPAVNEAGTTTNATTTIPEQPSSGQFKASEVIGKSVEGRDITAYHYGSGSREILFVGGIHGGYEWNTVLLSYQLMDYLKANPGVIPSKVMVTIIPTLNPDGLNKVVGTAGRFTVGDVSSSQSVLTAGRFNAQNVDLSRNFDCDWQAKATWQNKTISGGSAAFSEPESQALRDYVVSRHPVAAVVLYSAAGGVFASSCGGKISADTSALSAIYANASGYPAYDEFDAYKITGDAVNWLAKENIPAISVLLTSHDSTELAKNKAGLEAVLNHYAD